MTSKECKMLSTKAFSKRKRLVEQVVKANKNLNDLELLNWTMNQLFRSARELELLSTIYCEEDSLTSIGCDASAEVILERLVTTKEGWDLVYKTNPKLLIGYKKP